MEINIPIPSLPGRNKKSYKRNIVRNKNIAYVIFKLIVDIKL